MPIVCFSLPIDLYSVPLYVAFGLYQSMNLFSSSAAACKSQYHLCIRTVSFFALLDSFLDGQGRNLAHHLGRDYHVNFLGLLGKNGFHLR